MIRMTQATERISKRLRLLYLAGPIVEDDDWQDELFQSLIAMKMPLGWEILNPRPAQRIKKYETLIEWQYNATLHADAFAFWFPKGTCDSFSMFDVGRWTTYERPIAVGIHPKSETIDFLSLHLSYSNPAIKIVSSIKDLAKQAVENAKNFVVPAS